MCDLFRAEQFYVEVLGLIVAKRFSKGFPHIILNVGSSYIALLEAPHLAIKSPIEILSETGYMHFSFKIKCGQFLLAVEKLKGKNVNIVGGPVYRGEGDSVYF